MRMADVLAIAMTARAIRRSFAVSSFTIFEAKVKFRAGKVILFPDQYVKVIIFREPFHSMPQSKWLPDHCLVTVDKSSLSR